MNEAVNEILISVILSLISAASAYLILWLRNLTEKLKTETNKLKAESEQKLFREALNELERITETTVRSMEETFAKDIRKGISEGGATRKELLELAPRAAATVFKNMKKEYLDYLEKNMVNLTDYALDVIEKKVNEMKQ